MILLKLTLKPLLWTLMSYCITDLFQLSIFVERTVNVRLSEYVFNHNLLIKHDNLHIHVFTALVPVTKL